MDILQAITQELGVQKWQVEAAVKFQIGRASCRERV